MIYFKIYFNTAPSLRQPKRKGSVHPKIKVKFYMRYLSLHPHPVSENGLESKRGSNRESPPHGQPSRSVSRSLPQSRSFPQSQSLSRFLSPSLGRHGGSGSQPHPVSPPMQPFRLNNSKNNKIILQFIVSSPFFHTLSYAKESENVTVARASYIHRKRVHSLAAWQTFI